MYRHNTDSLDCTCTCLWEMLFHCHRIHMQCRTIALWVRLGNNCRQYWTVIIRDCIILCVIVLYYTYTPVLSSVHTCVYNPLHKSICSTVLKSSIKQLKFQTLLLIIIVTHYNTLMIVTKMLLNVLIKMKCHLQG